MAMFILFDKLYHRICVIDVMNLIKYAQDASDFVNVQLYSHLLFQANSN